MVIDSSALVAIMRAEPERVSFLRAIERATVRKIAAPTLLETSMVLVGRQVPEILLELDALLRASAIELVPFTPAHALAAREAFLRYGKGRHHAALNFGDCITYATAKLAAMPLLFKGGDFALTDV